MDRRDVLKLGTFEIGDVVGFCPGHFVGTSPIPSLRADEELGVVACADPSVWPVSAGLAFADPGRTNRPDT